MTADLLTQTRRSGVARGSVTVSAWTLVSRLTGVLRVVAIGAVLGPTFFANAFLAANTVPQLVFTMVAGSVLSLVLVPALVRALLDAGRDGAVRVLGGVTGLLLAGSTAVAGLLVVLSPVLAWLLTLGVPDGERAQARTLTTVMVLFVAPQVVLYTLGAIGTAAQQARDRFALAAAAPALENLGLVATMVLVATTYRPGLEVGEVPFGLVVLLGVGATASVAVHTAVQLAGAARAGLRLRPARSWRDEPATREIVALLKGSVVVAACPALGYFGLLAVAATVPGGVLVLQIAYTVYAVPLALGAKAVSTAGLPGLAESIKLGDESGFAAAWRQSLGYVVVAALPPLLLLAAFARPIAETLAAGQLDTGDLVGTLALCIVVVAVAQLPAGIHDVGRQALFARLDARGARVAALSHLFATTCVGLLALLLPAGWPRLVGLSVAVLAGALVSAAVALGLLHRAIRPEPLADARRLAVAGRATAAMLPVVALGGWVVRTPGGGPWRDVPVALLAGAVATAVFALVLRTGTRRLDAAGEPARPGGVRWERRLVASGLAAATAAGLAVVAAGPVVLVIVACSGLFVLCAVRPVVATYAYLASLPFLVGIDRGEILPLVRPNEALLVLVIAGVLTGGVLRRAGGAPLRLRVRPLDGPLAAFFLLATVWPLTSLLLRGVAPAPEDMAALLPICKLVGVLLLVRTTVTTERGLLWCVRMIIWPAAAVAVIAVLQTLRVAPVIDLLAAYWPVGDDPTILAERGTTTFAHSIATGDYVLVALALVITFGLRGLIGRRERLVLGVLLGAGVLGAGQFSTWLAALVAGAVILWRVPATRPQVVRFLPVMAVAAAVGLPALAGRLASFGEGNLLPQSWLVRWDNITHFYVPPLQGLGLLLGVTPDTTLRAPETWREEIFLESGYLQLLWTGGLPLLCAFAWLSVTLLRRARALGVRRDGVGAAASALEIAWVIVLVLSLLDIHLLLRGMGEVLFTLIAVATGRLHEQRDPRP